MKINILKRILLTTGISSMLILSNGCSDIVLKVGKKESKNSSQLDSITATTEKTSSEVNIDTVIDYVKGIDDLSNAEKIKQVISLLSGSFKDDFRKALRKFRSSIVKNATKDRKYKDDAFKQIDAISCKDIDKLDLSVIESNDDLALLLQGSVLAGLNNTSARNLDKSLPGKLDEIAKIILLSELGIKADVKTKTKVELDGKTRTTTAKIGWKVMPYKDELTKQTEAEKAEDKLAVVFEFTRTQKENGPEIFKLDVKVAEGLLENQGKATSDIYYLQLFTKKFKSDKGVTTLKVNVNHGIKTKTTDNRVFGRSMTFKQYKKQNSDDQKQEYYYLKDEINVGVAGKEVTAKIYDLDLAALKQCSINDKDANDIDFDNDDVNQDIDDADDKDIENITDINDEQLQDNNSSKGDEQNKDDDDYSTPDDAKGDVPSKDDTPEQNDYDKPSQNNDKIPSQNDNNTPSQNDNKTPNQNG